jgi:hypothetical protein
MVNQTERTHPVITRVKPAGLAKINELRGEWSISEYVRQALGLAVKQGLRGPRKVDLYL